MRRVMALALLLALSGAWCVAQKPPAEEKIDETGLERFPPINFFEGRPLYRVGDGVKPPKIVEAPEPEPLRDFRPARVVLWCIVGIDGKPYMLRVAKRASLEADQKAIQTVSKWRWKPGTAEKNKEVDVLTTVEVVWR